MTTADISHVSKKDENYLRMRLLLTTVALRAGRIFFDKVFGSSSLEKKFNKEQHRLFTLKEKHFIKGAHWNLLFPNKGAPNSETFDVQLIIALIRNLTELPPPTGGYDFLPLRTDTTETADLVRIKHYRDHLVHVIDEDDDNDETSASFDTAWEDITKAVGRLGGKNMEDECKLIRTKHLNCATVPCDIRAQICKTLDEWRKNDLNFVTTSAAEQVLTCVQENNCVTIVAGAGVGKTAILRHIVLKMEDSKFDILPVTNPNDIVEFNNPEKKTLFVIDDFCGKYSINLHDINNWEPLLEDIGELIKNEHTKIVVASRLQVFKDEKLESLSIFTTNVCNLSSEDLCLSQTEKQLIADTYLRMQASEIIKYCDLFQCFPLLCKLYHDNPTLKITEFLQNAYLVYESEIEQLRKNEHLSKYHALALLVIFNNALEEEVLKDEISTETKTIIKSTCEACSPNTVTARLVLLDELNLLQHTFIKNDQGVYKAVNNEVFLFLSFYFGQNIIQCILKHADSKLIKERFVIEKKACKDQFITVVPFEYHFLFNQRMEND